MTEGGKREKVLVIGAGGFGTALAVVLYGNGHDVRVWGRRAELMERIERERTNSTYLPGVELPGGLRFTSDVGRASEGVEVVLSVIPTQFLRGVIGSLCESMPAPRIVTSCS